MLKLYILFLISAYFQSASAIWPVKDFRTSAISSLELTFKQAVLAPNSAVSTSEPTATHNPTSVASESAIPSAAPSEGGLPVVQLTESSFFIETDSSRSIYFVNTNILDPESSYNKTFPLLIDTGSSMSWLYNESCSSGPCTSAAKFDDSSLALKSIAPFSLSYSGDDVSGEIVSTNGTDAEFAIESAFSSLSLKNVSFGLSTSSPAIFDGYDISGVIGIPSTNLMDSNVNFVHQMAINKFIDKQVFSIILNTNNSAVSYINNQQEETPAAYGGVMFLGSASNPFTSEPSNPVVYVDVIENTNSYWMWNISSIQVVQNDTSSPSAFNNSAPLRQAIVDTGTTGIVLPMYDADQVHQQLFGSQSISDGAGNYAFPCSATNAKLVLNTPGGNTLTLSSSFFMGNAYTTKGLEGYCASKIQGTGTNELWILGAAFLSQYYTTFDIDEQSMGFTLIGDSSYIIKAPTTGPISSLGSIYPNSTNTFITVSSSHASTASNGTSSSGTKNNGNGIYQSRNPFYKAIFIILCLII